MRMGMSVGSTTDASSLSDQVKRYKLREFKESDAGDYQQPPKGGPERPPNPAHEALTDKCIKVVVDNFAERPVHEAVPAKHMREITARLPVDMDPTVTAVYVFDEVRAAPLTAALRSSQDHAAATPSCPHPFPNNNNNKSARRRRRRHKLRLRSRPTRLWPPRITGSGAASSGSAGRTARSSSTG